MPGAVIGSPARARSELLAERRLDASAGMPPGRRAWAFAGERHDGRFKAHRARSGIEHERDLVAELLDHMLGPGRAEAAREVGGGRGERPSKAAITSRAGPRGARSAMVCKPGGCERMHRRIRWSGTTSDSGPGQNFSASICGARVSTP